MQAKVMTQQLPRVVNTYRERAPIEDADQRDRLVIRVDREPSEAETRTLLQSDDLREVVAGCATALFRWPTGGETSFNLLGFFSPEIERFRERVHQSAQAEPWLVFARDLTTFGLEILLATDIPKYEGDRLTAAALFGRAHESMQAAVTLAERGMIGDARAVARSAVENAIALHALASGDALCDRLVGAKAHADLQLARMLLEVSNVRSQMSTEDIKHVEAIRNAAAALPKEKRQPINWSDLARDYGASDLYSTLYRMLSYDGTHVSVGAIVRRFEQDEAGEITMMKCGPDTAGLVSALNAATTAFLNCVQPFLKLYSSPAHTAKLEEFAERFNRMGVAELDWDASRLEEGPRQK